MPCITIPLDPLGPIIEIGISLPGGFPQANPAPPIQWIKAIADTGCTHTSIHHSVAAKLGLKVLSKGIANTANGPAAANIYHGDMFLRPQIGGKPFEWRYADRQLLELAQNHPKYDALLGMDILSDGLFSVNGALNCATFCW